MASLKTLFLRHVPKPVLSFLIFLILPIFILCALLSSLWRKLLLVLVVRKLHPQVTHLVDPRSMGFGVDPLYSSPKCVVLISAKFEGTLELQTLKNALEHQFLNATLPNGVPAYDEANRQHIRSYFGYLFWQNNSTPFILDEVAFSVDYTTEEDLQELKVRLLHTPFEKNKPLYSVYLIRKLENDENKCMCLVRFHHVLGDGLSGLHLFIVHLAQAQSQMPNWSSLIVEQKSPWVDKIKYATLFPFHFSNELASCFQFKRRIHFMIPEKAKSGAFYMKECKEVSVTKVKEIKRGFNVSFTSVIIAVITSVLREVLTDRGCLIDESEEIPCLLPIPIPIKMERLRNYLSGAWTVLPIGEPLPLQRLYKCEADMKRIKMSTVPYAMSGMNWLIGSFPSALVKLASSSSFAPIGISNLPGPSIDLYWKEAKSSCACYSAGLQNGVTGIVFCVTTYSDKLVVTFSAAAEAVTMSEVNFMRRRIPMIFEEYLKLMNN